MMPKQKSNFVHNDNHQLAGLSDAPQTENDIADIEDYYKNHPIYGGLPLAAALGLNIGVKLLGAVSTVWIGSKILGYDHD